MQQNISILIIDDDIGICDLLSDIFSEHGYRVIAVQNAKDALNLLNKDNNFSLIILDLILPDINGLFLLQKIKDITSIPIIMLSGLDTESDIVVGLEMGADDYISKPFHPRIVVARARVAIRRNSIQNLLPDNMNQGYIFDNWILDTDSHKLFSPQKKEIRLTPGEYILLHALVSNSKKVLSRQKLLELTHSENFDIFDRTIDVLIMRLRKKIEPNHQSPKFIQTIRGSGYIFSCLAQYYDNK